MRVSAGVEAARECELAGCDGRMVCEVRSWNRFAVNRKTPRFATRAPAWSEKDQSDQDNDRDPDDHIRDDDAVSQPAIRRAVALQCGAPGVFSRHRFLPGKMFRDERIVSCGRFDLLQLCGHRRLVTRLMRTFASCRLRDVIKLSMNEVVSKQRRTVRQTINAMLHLFDPKIESKSQAGLRAAIMHGSIEVHAAY